MYIMCICISYQSYRDMIHHDSGLFHHIYYTVIEHVSAFLILFAISFKYGLPKIIYSYWFIIIFFFFILRKILNISEYSIFNYFSFFYLSKKFLIAV